MDEIIKTSFGDSEWPPEAEEMYERVEVLGRGSFGTVWMAHRISESKNALDDEFVAIKNIEIKEEKSRVYAQREISILKEISHPNVIRLIRAFPIYKNRCQLVAMEMARGPNLQYLVTRRGALGLPLSRLIARHLIAAVSYLHGRAVIHRDIKPTNCILENTELATQDIYDWIGDDMIWSDSEEAGRIVASGKFKLMLVDFGFARALSGEEIQKQPRRMRNSIVNETQGMTLQDIAKLVADEDEEETKTQLRRASVVDGLLVTDIEAITEEDSKEAESKEGENKEGDPERAADGPPKRQMKRRQSHVSVPPQNVNGAGKPLEGEKGEKIEKKEEEEKITRKEPTRKPGGRVNKRASMTRARIRSMSALGTKAYAAPEIKHELRNKTRDDVERSLEALTECVADYGMIVDAYSVGWTLRVILTGIPPNVTISKYMKKVASLHEQVNTTGCLCFKRKAPPPPELKVRDISQLPKDATLLISMLTRTKPENRVTVREAQKHPYIRGGAGSDPVFVMPSGDYPSQCGDPVVPLNCAEALATQQKERER